MNKNLNNFIESIYNMHLDNAIAFYETKYLSNQFSRSYNNHSLVTSFVYEFFIFNSLYQIDWSTTLNSNEIQYHDRDCGELKQQRHFLKTIKNIFEKDDLNEIFDVFSYIRDIKGNWTNVIEDSRITKFEGECFFSNVLKLQNDVKQKNIVPNSDFWKNIKNCLFFITNVRNNIFHGTKTLEQSLEKNQSSRIEIYELYLRCINSLFFRVVFNKRKLASSLCQFSIYNEDYYQFIKQKIHQSVHQNIMKHNDVRLIKHIEKLFTNNILSNSNTDGVMFYPSSGNDILTPFLIGFNFCNEFYFYDKSRRFINNYRRILSSLNKIFDDIKIVELNDSLEFSIKTNTQNKKIILVCSDNLNFLKKNKKIDFFFRRGDSVGEGGSNQNWDGDFFEHIVNYSNHNAVFITDGKPGKISLDLLKLVKNDIEISSSTRKTKYFIGNICK